jgi:glutamyl-tRNA synthetase
MILGPDGAKLSKRHGALGIDAYRDMGYLPEALRNYLLRLGWGHGDDEIISTAQAIDWFDLSGIGRSPARFDFAKLDNLNGHYIREVDDERLIALVSGRLGALDAVHLDRLSAGMGGLKARARTLVELAQNAKFYVTDGPLSLDEKAGALATTDAKQLLSGLPQALGTVSDWTEAPIETAIRNFAEAHGVKLGMVAQPLRAALTGSTVSPGIFEVMRVLGRNETMSRIADFAALRND